MSQVSSSTLAPTNYYGKQAPSHDALNAQLKGFSPTKSNLIAITHFFTRVIIKASYVDTEKFSKCLHNINTATSSDALAESISEAFSLFFSAANDTQNTQLLQKVINDERGNLFGGIDFNQGHLLLGSTCSSQSSLSLAAETDKPVAASSKIETLASYKEHGVSHCELGELMKLEEWNLCDGFETQVLNDVAYFFLEMTYHYILSKDGSHLYTTDEIQKIFDKITDIDVPLSTSNADKCFIVLEKLLEEFESRNISFTVSMLETVIGTYDEGGNPKQYLYPVLAGIEKLAETYPIIRDLPIQKTQDTDIQAPQNKSTPVNKSLLLNTSFKTQDFRVIAIVLRDNVGTKWHEFGLQLGVNHKKLNAIKNEHESKMAILLMLSCWFATADKSVLTPNKLLKALRSRTVGENSFAAELEKKLLEANFLKVPKYPRQSPTEQAIFSRFIYTHDLFYSECSEWYAFGIAIGLSCGELDRINHDFRGSKKQMSETLSTYLQQRGTGANCHELKQGLILIGQPSLAEKVEATYKKLFLAEFNKNKVL